MHTRVLVLAGIASLLGACATSRIEYTHPVPAASASLVANATAMLGQPYRYGGAAPGGFDCSGLVVYAATNAGLRLPRTAAEQIRVGVPVKRQELRAGDLVFMHLKHKELHVGIAVDADRFVHAPAAGRKVRIDSLSAQPYRQAFLTARRIVLPGRAASGLQSTEEDFQ